MHPYVADIGINLDAVNSGLRAVKALRCTVGEVFRTLTDGVPCSQGDEKKEKNFIRELQGMLGAVISRIRELETAVTLLGSPNAPLSLGSTGHLCQDPTLDRTSLYTDMIKSYRWFDKVHEHTSHASAILTQNGLKRSNSSLFPTKRLRRPHSNGHNFSPQNVDAFISSLQRQFVDMSIEILRPCGNSAVLKITLSRTMRALVCLRGLIIEWVLVKAFNEDFYTDDDQLDMWSKSRYRVFHKVTEHANAAMLHFFSPQLPDLAVKSFLTWLHSYLHLFSAFCRRCGTRLQHSMPPTWRDLRNLDVYHETCRP
ncbi:mediator of RNA polymerase II transcription subunit 27 isoform X2 [Rhipicephalus microplus]|uniref:Putative cofactor required for sp1 transcriptional activation subunit 8 n=1 Tax=Rhipicephalus microplus TaxID=6941 RepID=A0A6M2CSJ6_RHIMP|nr:mediator of RNA polymerase II transcription subunit 27-like isoform X2 [Rhipicephalus microplus]